MKKILSYYEWIETFIGVWVISMVPPLGLVVMDSSTLYLENVYLLKSKLRDRNPFYFIIQQPVKEVTRARRRKSDFIKDKQLSIILCDVKKMIKLGLIGIFHP